MATETNKINMFLRDDRTLFVEVHYESGAAVDLSDSKIWFTVKQKTSDPDTSAILSKKNEAAGGADTEILIVEPAENGQAQVFLTPDDTDLVNPGVYSYDVQVLLANGKTYTAVRDQIIFKEDVTKAKS
jgi:hypothetical protein